VARRWQAHRAGEEDAMAIDLDRLLQKAFFVEQVHNATEALERARTQFIADTKTGGVSFELVVPPAPDEPWVLERLLRPLIYYCESEGSPVPHCPGVFVSLFLGSTLYCVRVAEVLNWAEDQLTISVEELRDRYGTHEAGTALR
jgi:hypothetical protein